MTNNKTLLDNWEKEFEKQFFIVGKDYLLNSKFPQVGRVLTNDLKNFIKSLLQAQRKKRC